jgi:hypothetical protein
LVDHLSLIFRSPDRAVLQPELAMRRSIPQLLREAISTPLFGAEGHLYQDENEGNFHMVKCPDLLMYYFEESQ